MQGGDGGNDLIAGELDLGWEISNGKRKCWQTAKKENMVESEERQSGREELIGGNNPSVFF